MRQRVLPGLMLCLLGLPVWAQSLPETGPAPATEAVPSVPAQPPATADSSDSSNAAEALEPVPQTILVSGSRPGPGLWKVSKGEHVMWVFGNYAPLPAKMEWRSREVEKAVAQSQEYLKPPTSRVSVGMFGSLGALPFLIGVKKNPDGAELMDVLPPDVYARWLPLKEKYFANDRGIERERPSFVAAALSDRAIKAAGLTQTTEVGGVVAGFVKKYGLKVTDPTVEVEIKHPGQAVRDFKKTAMDDVPCLAKTMERLESELGVLRELANAWAVGELEGIRKLNYGDRAACMRAVTTSSLTKNQPELLTLNERALASWVAAAEKALATNTNTFAMLPLKEILDPNGVIATLRAKGYTVEAPQ